ncbi:PKD domain-containing protein [Rurimicrobium arvi]
MKRFLQLAAMLIASSSVLAQNARLEFVRNKGQWDGNFAYKCSGPNAEIFVQENAITYQVAEQGAWDKIDAYKHGQLTNAPRIKYHVYRTVFEGAKQPVFEEGKIQKHYYNYFLGNDSSKWASGIHPALSLDFKGIYNGVDLHLSSENSTLKYDFIVAPNADATQIRLRFDGTEKVHIDQKGNLVISTSVGDATEEKPFVYQYVNEERVVVPCRYKLEANNTVSFVFPKGYNHEAPLLIDPKVIFATFTGSTADNWGFTATYDRNGNMYAGGSVSAVGGTSFPVTTGAFQTTWGGGTSSTGNLFPADMAIMKINTDGTTKIYATYIGGSDNDQPHSMIVDESDNLIIAGRTYSANYPVSATAYDRTWNGGADLVVTVLNSAGTGINGSTYIGGSGDDCVNIDAQEFTGGSLKHNYGDDARSEVIIDRNSNIYVASCTNSSNFPTQSPILGSIQGQQDAVLVKLNSNVSSLLFSTYLGGSDDDAGYVLALNKAQTSVFIAGGTNSSDFPTTAAAYQPAYAGATDGFILKISNSAPYTLQAGSFLGKGSYDQIYGVAVDDKDFVYVMGQTLGGTFPVSSGVYSNPNSSQFVMKMMNNLSGYVFSTVFGSGNSSATNISPVAFLVDTCENIYISGWGGTLGGSAFPNTGTTNGMPITSSAFQTSTDGFDFYFIVLNKDASSLVYGSYYGRSSTNPMLGEHVDGGTSRFDKSGIIYQAICGGCGGPSTPALPTTPGTISPKNGSGNCNLAALKITFELAPPVVDGSADNVSGCAPLTVNFKNNSTNGKVFSWSFGDGSPDVTTADSKHTFTKPGVYKVRFIATNPDACFDQTDTMYFTVTVDTNSVAADFSYFMIDTCNAPYRVKFTNTSSFGRSGTATFTWRFGDGSTYTGANPPVHEYAAKGTYTVTLIMRDDLSCNAVDSISKTITIQNLFIKAAATIPPSLCTKGSSATFVFSTVASDGTTYYWDFGDGSFSTASNPSHSYSVGTYKVRLIVKNDKACNSIDSVSGIIVISPGPLADFDFEPRIPVENDSIRYKNLSKNATGYTWYFGDGMQSTLESPAHLFLKSGTYKTCLVASISGSCPDTVCKNVEALIVPRLDVPTAFTPNNDGVNDVIYVRGAAIQHMDFYIYNRWGQQVFHSANMEVGWDGNYNGSPQPMEGYAYVVNATFINGETETKRGNITLLR